MEVCQGLGVTLGQGYLFSKPLPIEQLSGAPEAFTVESFTPAA